MLSRRQVVGSKLWERNPLQLVGEKNMIDDDDDDDDDDNDHDDTYLPVCVEEVFQQKRCCFPKTSSSCFFPIVYIYKYIIIYIIIYIYI